MTASSSAESMLHHDLIRPAGKVEHWMLFLHGIYGMGRNWNAVARRVIAGRPGWGAVMVDLREHGASQGRTPPHTMDAAAGDVVELIGSLDAPVGAIVGHSFGGKVALMAARALGAAAPSEIWIIDSTPAARAKPGGSAWEMLDHLRKSSGVFRTRAMAVTELALRGVDEGTAQWISSNLERSREGNYTWKIDMNAMEQLLRSFFAADVWDVVESPPGRSVLHFVRATQASTLEEDDLIRLRKAVGASGGRVVLHDVKGGHWLNADNPDALVELMAGALARK